VDDVVAVVTDLFFQARISAAGRAAGRHVRFIASEDAESAQGGFRLALVDLDAGVDVLAAIREMKALSQSPVVAFGPHLDTEARKAAKSAGADRVLAKSKFVTDLPQIMAEDGGGL
jgi:CheY-like chemotaxis protein